MMGFIVSVLYWSSLKSAMAFVLLSVYARARKEVSTGSFSLYVS